MHTGRVAKPGIYIPLYFWKTSKPRKTENTSKTNTKNKKFWEELIAYFP
jgi:hypothetical protein